LGAGFGERTDRVKKSGKWIFLAAVLAAGVGGWMAWGPRSGGPRNGKSPEYQQVPVQRGDLKVTVQATGVVQPQNRLEIKPPIAGRVEEVLVKEGEPVKKGKVLAWMSSTERAALLDAARAKGPESLAHWEEIYKPAPLIAPLDGTIIGRKVEPGQTVTAQDAVFVLSDRLIILAQVDETDIGQIRLRQGAEVALDAYPEQKITASVDQIGYEAKTVNNVTIYEVDVLPREVPEVMRSGMTANVTFVIEEKQGVLRVPAEAVRREQGQASVRIAGRPGGSAPEAKPVETGITDGKWVEVVSGLSEGDSVLVRSKGGLPARKNLKSPFTPDFQRRR